MNFAYFWRYYVYILMQISKVPFLLSKLLPIFLVCAVGTQTVAAAPPSRITRAVNVARTRLLPGNLNPLAQAKNDLGAVDSAMPMDYMVLLFKSSAAQQQELDGLLTDQQNPSSAQFHKWLTPEDFGERFGLSQQDHSKMAAWLKSEGLTVNEGGRGRNWIAFSGTAGQVSRALHTSIHKFKVNGETHYSNVTEPSIPEALADVAGAFIGLQNFRLKSGARPGPAFTTANSAHFLAPEDYATIYNIAPLYKAGFDGTGQSIAIVGESAIQVSDLRAFKTRFNLPANDPKVILYGGADPGFSDVNRQLEANLDLEWSSALAPKASLTYIYGQNVFTALVTAVNLNTAQVISVSYGACELNISPFYRSFAQQANAQGITIFVASGDAGNAGCDSQGSELFAARGQIIPFPSNLPEVTSVGGTQFVEGDGNYWAATNSPNGASALSYIPEVPLKESDSFGLFAGGGGASKIYPKPLWQTGPGVPNDGMRDTPDVSLSAAGHDAYLVYFSAQGFPAGLYRVSGTSAAAPAMAGIVTLLNQYQVAKKFQQQPGLGNINPQLYRLARTSPDAFHDITTGDNYVNCVQGSLDCALGFFGYQATPGYDLATGLGSVDANNLVTNWNTATANVSVTLTVDTTRAIPGINGNVVSLNDTVTATARVQVISGNGAPTGTVDFSVGSVPFGSVPLSYDSVSPYATAAIQVGRLGVGRYRITAEYSGDPTFSSSGATQPLQVIAPAGSSAIVLTGPSLVFPSDVIHPEASAYQTFLTLREQGGVPAVVTGFSIDGQPQPLAQYFPTTALQANSSLTIQVPLRNVANFSTHTFAVQFIDASGVAGTRQITVTYYPLPEFSDIGVKAFPLTVLQDASKPSCEWPVRLSIDDLGGFSDTITGLSVGFVDYTSQIVPTFGTRRVETLGSLQGTLCLNGYAPPLTQTIEIDFASGLAQQVTVTLLPSTTAPAKLSASPATISLAASPGRNGQATVAINLSDKSQLWTATVLPANRTTGWLTTSALFGTGSGQITLNASAAGYAPGAYRATLLIQSPNAVPQTVEVPILFVNGGSATGTLITGAGNAAALNQSTIAPGMILTLVGAKLANTTETVSTNPLPYSTAGVTATVNGIAAPILYASPGQINLQVPYGVGTGPGVVGINNNGEVAGFAVQIAPAAPGIFTDASGQVTPSATVKQDGSLTLLLTGAGDITSTLRTAFAPALNTAAAQLPKPLLPISATIGGAQVFVQSASLAPGLFGVTRVILLIPQSVPTGLQPVVITINGVASSAALVTVEPPVGSTQ